MNDLPAMNESDFDDHEPGDVNGNVDPAWAKKQKQNAKQDTRRNSRRERAPRVSNATRADNAWPAAPTANEAASENSVGTQAEHRDAPQQGVSEVQESTAHSGDRRARGPRRSRRNPSQRAPRDAGGSTQLERESAEGESAAGVSAEIASTAGEPMSDVSQEISNESRIGFSPEGLISSGQRRNRRQPRKNNFSTDRPEENVSSSDALDAENLGNSPNPGAFGDPSRPMDRSARDNRNRNRNRDKNERARAIRDARIATQASEAASDTAEAAEGDIGASGEGGGERLHKVLAQQGLGSRRAMESLIEAGEVEVNGERAHVGQVVNERDRVYVKRRKVNVKLGDDKPRILIYHKPSGEIVSRDDPEARDSVFDRLPKPDHGKWVAIGRLDFNTEGLLLFTTYGELANRMTHPRYEVPREYSVRILGELTPEQEDQLIDGIELDDGPARVLSLDRIDRDSDGANHWYRITINEGRNREVRRMFEHLELTVSRLIRTRYGVVNMPSWLKRGQYKLLDENDTFNVLESVGLRSRKKLEKAARFGGARGKLPQGPVGPMRSATEHESIWNGGAMGSAVGGGLPGAGGDRNRHGRDGRNGRGRDGARGRNDAFGASPSMQQQQFPGFGGASEALPARPARGMKRRGRGGEVNGNIDPNFKPFANGNRRQGQARGQAQGQGQGQGPRQGQGRNRRGRPRQNEFGADGSAVAGLPRDADDAFNNVSADVQPGLPMGDGAPQQRRPRRDNTGGNNGNSGRGRNRRGRRPSGDRNANGAGFNGAQTSGEMNSVGGENSAAGFEAAPAPGTSGDGAPRREPRSRRFGNRGRRPRGEGAAAGGGETLSAGGGEE